jgi:hypothetical protein
MLVPGYMLACALDRYREGFRGFAGIDILLLFMIIVLRVYVALKAFSYAALLER